MENQNIRNLIIIIPRTKRTIMRHILLFAFSFLIAVSFLNAQNGRTPAVEDFPNFKKSTMLVVLDGVDETYNNAIKVAVATYWTITPFQFVTQDEFFHLDGQNEDNYSMLIRNNSERIFKRVNRETKIKSNHLAIYMYNKGIDLRNYTGRDALTQFHLPDVMDTEAYLYKLTAMVQNMQRYLEFLESTEITEDTHPGLVESFNNQDVGSLADRTLYLLAEQLPEKLQDVEKLKKVYKYNIAIIEKEGIAQAIEAQQPDGAFLHTDPRTKTMYILATDGGKILYAADLNKPGEIGNSDFAALSRKI